MQTAKDIMTPNPACCTPLTALTEVAKMMVQFDCGEIPVIESHSSKKLVGVITDRDITVRAVARGLNPLDLTAQDCMSTPAVFADLKMDLDECIELMADHQIRRLPVVDENQFVCGMISQADIAEQATDEDTVHVVRQVSQPSEAPGAYH
jgi:CBS domain-containing protein